MEYIKNNNQMQEDQVYQWWEYYARTKTRLSSFGNELIILNAGKFNSSCGPDYVSARFVLNRVIYQGDVECHINAEDWYRHQHHLDKAYRNVILHIVASLTKDIPVKTAWNEQNILTFCISKPSNHENNEHPINYCKATKKYRKYLLANLKSLALDRFNHKIKVFLSEMDNQNENEVLYQYFMRVLGYPYNSMAFQLLANRLSWDWLVKNQQIYGSSPDILYALYAGLASFIPYTITDSYTENLKNVYDLNYKSLPGLPVDARQWQFAAIRPQNHPHFRLAGWVYLIHYYSMGIFTGLSQIISERIEVQKTIKKIYHYINRPTDEYWAYHYALGKLKTGGKNQIFISKARLTEILMNTFLPFFATKAHLSGSEGFSNYLTSFFLELPHVISYQQILRSVPFAKQCIDIWPCQTVYQALINLKTNFCDQSLCQNCPMCRIPG